MGRVVRIGPGLMGVLLVVMTTGLSFVRSRPSTLQVMLANGWDGNSSRTYLAAPQIGWKRPITSNYYATRGGVWSPDSEWYLWTQSRTFDEYDVSEGDVWRIRADGSSLERLPQRYFPADPFWTRDGQAYLYRWQGDIYLSNLDGRHVENLTKNFETPLSTDQIIYSPDEQWVIFLATRIGSNGVYSNEVYRMKLSDQTLIQLSDIYTFGSSYIPLFWIDEGASLIGSTQDAVYRMLPDGSNRENLYVYDIREIRVSIPDLKIEVLLPKNNMLVLFLWGRKPLDDATVGLRISDGAVLWNLPGLTYWGFTPDERWLMFYGEDGSFYRMHPTEQVPQLVTPFHGSLPYRLSPDGQWLVYDEVDAQNQTRSYLLRLENGESQLLSNNMSVAGWSPDSRWVILVDYSLAHREPKLMNIETQETILLKIDDLHLGILAWLQLPKAEWQPYMLLIIGMGLIGISIFGKRPFHHLRQRLRPAA